MTAQFLVLACLCAQDVAGTIIDARTDQGVPLVEMAASMQGVAAETKFTDKNGDFEFKNVVAGSMTLRVSKQGYYGYSIRVSAPKRDIKIRLYKKDGDRTHYEKVAVQIIKDVEASATPQKAWSDTSLFFKATIGLPPSEFSALTQALKAARPKTPLPGFHEYWNLAPKDVLEAEHKFTDDKAQTHKAGNTEEEKSLKTLPMGVLTDIAAHQLRAKELAPEGKEAYLREFGEVWGAKLAQELKVKLAQFEKAESLVIK